MGGDRILQPLEAQPLVQGVPQPPAARDRRNAGRAVQGGIAHRMLLVSTRPPTTSTAPTATRAGLALPPMATRPSASSWAGVGQGVLGSLARTLVGFSTGSPGQPPSACSSSSSVFALSPASSACLACSTRSRSTPSVSSASVASLIRSAARSICSGWVRRIATAVCTCVRAGTSSSPSCATAGAATTAIANQAPTTPPSSRSGRARTSRIITPPRVSPSAQDETTIDRSSVSARGPFVLAGVGQTSRGDATGRKVQRAAGHPARLVLRSSACGQALEDAVPFAESDSDELCLQRWQQLLPGGGQQPVGDAVDILLQPQVGGVEILATESQRRKLKASPDRYSASLPKRGHASIWVFSFHECVVPADLVGGEVVGAGPAAAGGLPPRAPPG